MSKATDALNADLAGANLRLRLITPRMADIHRKLGVYHPRARYHLQHIECAGGRDCTEGPAFVGDLVAMMREPC